jgi:hypothetical protein
MMMERQDIGYTDADAGVACCVANFNFVGEWLLFVVWLLLFFIYWMI